MLIIEIRGYRIWRKNESLAAAAVSRKVKILLQRMGLEKEAFTEIVPSLTRTCDGNNRLVPYVLIWSTSEKESSAVVEKLHKESPTLNIGQAILGRFIPGS